MRLIRRFIENNSGQIYVNLKGMQEEEAAVLQTVRFVNIPLV
jgi:hypothetical protein